MHLNRESPVESIAAEHLMGKRIVNRVATIVLVQHNLTFNEYKQGLGR